MQQKITITYTNGEEVTYDIFPPDYAKWERATSKSIQEFAGMYDLLHVSHSLTRERPLASQPRHLMSGWSRWSISK